MRRLFFASFGTVLLVAACVTTPPPRSDIVRICDENGCGDAPRDVETPQKPLISQEEKDHIASLEELSARDPRAAYDLALRYFRGDEVRQDSYKALVWMREAAERGNLEAQKALGSIYLTGLEEMGADFQEAEKWLTMAVNGGDEESRELLAEANAAKRSEQEYYKWQTRMRDVFSGYWHTGYRYLSYWRDGAWYFY